MIIKYLILFCLLYFINIEVNAATDKIICYYASWATTRPGNGKFVPEDIDPNLCTHINYAFLGLEHDGKLKILDEANEIEQEGLKRVSALKTANPNLKCLFSVGGWSAGTAIFTEISTDPVKRANMAASVIEYCETYGYDGIDVDWEYPMTGDKENYINLLRDLKTALEPKGYIVTVAVAANPVDGISYDIPAMSDILDIINIMTYDYHGSNGPETGQNSPLYPSSKESDWQKENRNANASIVNWLQSGADPQKLAIGMGFYGHAFNLADPNNHDLMSPAGGPADMGNYTQNVGTLGYNEICEFHPQGTTVWDDEQKVPYLYDGKLWVGFDNPQSAQEKAKYAKEHNLAGVMVWSIETDDLHGFCGEEKGLLKALHKALQ